MSKNEVVLLEAKDVYKGGFNSSTNKTHCLLGWCNKEFPDSKWNRRAKSKIRQVINNECNFDGMDEIMYEMKISMNPIDIIKFNDNYSTPRRLIARVWNRAMYLLGYTEGNPESGPLDE